MIILKTPKGWTGPKEVDGLKTGGFWRLAPGAGRRDGDKARPHKAARRLDEELSARRAVRRLRSAAARDRRLSLDEAVKHCTVGIGIWEWASNDRGGVPDVVMACAGDVPTLETLAAVSLLRKLLPELKIRVVNVVDLMTLQPHEEHPHGLTDHDFDALFTTDKPVSFAHHGYPWLIHRLTYRRTNHDNIHVRGYKEEGTTTTPFDMVVLNDLDRFHLVNDVVDRLPQLGYTAAYAKQAMRDKLIEHAAYIRQHGEDVPEVKDWRWSPIEPTVADAGAD
jgi:xylulose-5-phosphate/fructose-6-phosphate phosphoketolase